MAPNLHIFKNPMELATQFAGQLMNWAGNHSGDAFHLAISGGKTPDLLFSVLAEKYADSALWQKIHFWWVDERMVPPDHPESNFGVAQKLLFSQIPIPEENIHRIKGEYDPETEALSYSAQIRESLISRNGWPAFDLILLGMGDDAHTASIFPNQMELLQSEQICEIAAHPETRQKRVTLTGKVINNAGNVCFLITGKSKAKKLTEIYTNQETVKLLPAAHIHPVSNNLNWYVDEPATQFIH
ncbi:MAG TPA: 6-phosphogluconolactonase [Prolixibacteraceae bacterium]|nr:6-phosphogluconolactonase [Prolixibacteraceae bacterium]